MLIVSSDRYHTSGATDVKMDGPVLEEKSSFNMLGLPFSSKLDQGSYIVSITETVPKNTCRLHSFYEVSFSKVALYLYKSTIQPVVMSGLLLLTATWLC